jgi:hypothetical protein
VDAGEILLVPDDCGCADGVRKASASWWVRSSSSIVSSGHDERRLEAVRRWGGSADDAYVISLRDSPGDGCQSGSWREGRGLGGERGARAHRQGSNRRRTVAEASDSGDKFHQPGGMIFRGTKGKMERRGRASYSRGDASIMAGSKRN